MNLSFFKIKGWYVIVYICILTFLCWGSITHADGFEAEPNNYINEATAITVNGTYNGELSTSSDDDFYKFTLPTAGNIKVSMPNVPSKSWGVAIITSNGSIVDSFVTGNSEYASGNSFMNIGLPAGDYYLKVYYPSYGYSTGVGYSVTLDYEQSDLYEKEFNNDVANATNVFVNQVYTGVLSSSSDNDFYKFTLTKPGNMKISLPNIPSKQWAVKLITSSGKELDSLITNSSEYVTGVSTMETGLPAGDYYIQVFYPSYGYSTDVTYVLDIKYEESNYFEQEPNSTALSATPISTNNKYYGVLNNSSDDDYYIFDLHSDGNLQFSMPNMAGKSWAVYLRDANGNQLDSMATSSSNYVTENTTMEIGLPAGKYFLQIYYPSYGYSDNIPYSFDLKFTQSDIHEKETNNSALSATPIKVNNTYYGVLNSTSDNDYYQFTLDKEQNIIVSMPNVPKKYWGFRIRNSNGDVLQNISTNNSEYTTGNSSIELGLSSGTYYLEIYYPSYGYSDEFPYQFSILAPNASSTPTFTSFEGYKDVPVDKEWKVTFNLTLDVATIKEKNIYITDKYNKVVPILYILDRTRDNTSVTLKPVVPYAKGETYTLWIKDIKSESGMTLKENVKMMFITAK